MKKIKGKAVIRTLVIILVCAGIYTCTEALEKRHARNREVVKVSCIGNVTKVQYVPSSGWGIDDCTKIITTKTQFVLRGANMIFKKGDKVYIERQRKGTRYVFTKEDGKRYWLE